MIRMKSFVSFLLLWRLVDTTSAINIRGYNASSTITAAASSSTYNCVPGGPDNGQYLYSGYSTDQSLQCYCASVFDAWWLTTNPPTRTATRVRPNGATTETLTTSGSTIITSFLAASTETYTFTGNIGYDDGFDWYGSASAPCCSSCTIAAETVDVFFWPTPPVPSQATSFVSNNYTFVSPSVYIGFTSLYAYDFCGNVGGSYSTTVAFAPSELSSVGPPLPETVTQIFSFTYTDTVYDSTSTMVNTYSSAGPATVIDFRDLSQNCSTISGYNYLPGPFAIENNPTDLVVFYDPCHPTIILPSKIKTLDPAWSTCIDNAIGGFYDPPYSLTNTQGALQGFSPTVPPPASTPTAVSEQQSTTPPVKASPSPTLPPVGPPTTTPPAVQPTTTVPPPVKQSPSSAPQDPPSSSDSPPVDPSTAPSDPKTSNGSPPKSSVVVPPASDPAPTSPAVIGTKTLSSGNPVTVSGSAGPVTFSLASSNVVINGATTVPLSSLESVLSSISAAPSLASPSLVPGGSPVTVDGTTYSLPSTGGGVVVNGATTIPLTSAEVAISSAQQGAVGSAIASIIGASQSPGGGSLVIQSASTLGEVSIIGGSTFVIEGGSTVPIASATADGGKETVVGGSTVVIQPASTVGSVAIVGGTTYVIEGSSKVPIASATGQGNSSYYIQASGVGKGITYGRGVLALSILGICILGMGW